MIDRLDQIFVLLKHWLLGYLPAELANAGRRRHERGVYRRALSGAVRVDNGSGAQGRWAHPEPAWPESRGTVWHSAADGGRHQVADQGRYRSAQAPTRWFIFWRRCMLVVTVFMGFAVLPMGRNMVLVDMDAGLLFYFAMGASTELSVFMAGWSSRNKYSLLGAMRAVAQMISYEVALLLSSVVVVMMTGSLSLVKIVEAQNHYSYGLAALVHLHPVGIARGSDVCDCRRRQRRIARHSICRKASRNWWPGITRSIRDSNLRCSSWASTWRCFRSRDWASTLFLGGWIGAVSCVPVGPVVDMVLWEIVGLDVRLHLAARNAAAAQTGSADEFCVEVRAADVPAEFVCRRLVAVYG